MSKFSDDNGNVCTVAYFGSEEAAQKALASLTECTGCLDCSRCARCSDCSRCSGCSGCSGCSDCSDCSGCKRCSNCVDFYGGASSTGASSSVPTVPVIEDLHARMYAAVSQPGALDMNQWHTCKNTHCRAGWVVALAGEQGRALEKFHNTELAALLIYDASCPNYQINPARFYDSNADALEDMRKLAEGESEMERARR